MGSVVPLVIIGVCLFGAVVYRVVRRAVYRRNERRHGYEGQHSAGRRSGH